MVDDDSIFSKEGTVARSSADIVRFFYLQRLEDVLKAEKRFNVVLCESADFERVKREWKGSLLALLRLCTPRMKSKDSPGYVYSPVIILSLINDGGLGEASGLLVDYLELDMKITDISKVQDYDRTNIILSNKKKGYK